MEAILIMFGLLALMGIGTAAWVVWAEPVDGELRQSGVLTGLSVTVLVLAMALVVGLWPLERKSAPWPVNGLAGPGEAIEGAAYQVPGAAANFLR